MHFTTLTLLATSMVAAALPSYDFLNSPSANTKAPCLDKQVHLNSPPDTLDYLFKIKNLKTGQFMGAEYIHHFAQVTMGFDTVFTLRNGVLSPKDPNEEDGAPLAVDFSPLLIFPPRVALRRIDRPLDAPPSFPVRLFDKDGDLFINSPRQGMTIFSSFYSVFLVLLLIGLCALDTLFTAPDGRQGTPVLLLPPTGNPGDQDFMVVRV